MEPLPTSPSHRRKQQLKKTSSPTNDLNEVLDKIQLFNNAVKSFEKPKEQRTSEDHAILREALSKVSYLTTHASPGTLEVFISNCADTMEYEFFPKGSAIFHFGDSARKFYLILKGSVDIYIPKSAEDLHAELEELEKDINNNANDSSLPWSQTNLSNAHGELKSDPQLVRRDSTRNSGFNKSRKSFMNQPALEKRGSTLNKSTHAISYAGKVFRDRTSVLMKLGAFSKHIQTKNELFELFSKFEERKNLYIQNDVLCVKKVRNMGPGNHFGEVALSTDEPRTASVIAAEDVHVVSLTKQTYKAIFEEAIRVMSHKTKFFEDFFSNCDKERVSRFAYVFKERSYDFGQVFYSEGEPANEVFLLQEGEVQLVCTHGEKAKIKIDTQGNILVPSSTENLNANSKHNKLPQKQIKLSNISPGSMFGESEVLDNVPRTATAIASQHCVVYWTTAEEFGRLKLRHYDFREKVLEQHRAKETYRKERMEQLKKIDSQVAQKFRDMFEGRKSGSFRFRNEIIYDLEQQATPSNIKALVDAQKKTLSPARGDASPSNEILNSPMHTVSSPTNNFMIKSTAPPLQRLSSDPGNIFQVQSMDTSVASSPKAKQSLILDTKGSASFRINSIDASSRQKAIRGTSLLQEEFGKFTLASKNTKITVSDMVDRNLEFANAHRENRASERWFPVANKTHKRHATKLQESKPHDKKLRDILKTNATDLPLHRKDSEGVHKPEVRTRACTSYGSPRVQTASTFSEAFLARASSPSENQINVRGVSISGKTATIEGFSPRLSLSGEFIIGEKGDEVVENHINRKSSFSRPITMQMRTTRLTDYSQTTKQELADLELGAPWMKNTGSLQLSVNCMKPYYFIQTPTSPTYSQPLSVFPQGNFFSDVSSRSNSKQHNNTTTQSPRVPRPILSSRHNLFRTKPQRAYITQMHYAS